MKKATAYSVLIGICIVSGFAILSYYMYAVEVNEVEQEKKRVYDLVMNAVTLQVRNLDVFADMIGAFYDGSEQVTDDEFEIFVSHMLSGISEVRNIMVVRDDQIIQSYPIKNHDMSELDLSSEVVIINGTETMLVQHKEKENNITVLLFVDPQKIIPLSDILQKPYKVELIISDNTWFYSDLQGNKFFSEHQTNESLTVTEKVEFLGHDYTEPQVLIYRIWEKGFEVEPFVPVVMFASGGVVSCTVSFLFYRNFRSNSIIRKQKQEIEIINETLKKNQDILKKTQSLLLESDEKHRNIFELSPLGISVIDLDGKIISSNNKAVEIFGYPKNEVLGMHFTDFVTQNDIEKAKKLFSVVLHEGKISEQRVRCKRKDGTEFLAVINAGVMKDKNAQNSGIICIMS